jgi:hypothetical protein
MGFSIATFRTAAIALYVYPCQSKSLGGVELIPQPCVLQPSQSGNLISFNGLLSLEHI